MEETKAALRINGTEVGVPADPRVTLVDLLREMCSAHATREDCGLGTCASCTVVVDGAYVLGCLALAVQYAGREITTPGDTEAQNDEHRHCPGDPGTRGHHSVVTGAIGLYGGLTA